VLAIGGSVPEDEYPAAMSTPDALAKFEAILIEERDRLTQQIDDLGEGDDAAPVFDENFADSGQVSAEQSENRTLASSLQEQLNEVEHALAKFPLGTYGICEVSGEPIPMARLEAMPATRVRVEFAG